MRPTVKWTAFPLPQVSARAWSPQVSGKIAKAYRAGVDTASYSAPSHTSGFFGFPLAGCRALLRLGNGLAAV